jgi:hypothetical protein
MGRIPTRFWIRGEKHAASFAHDLFGHPELQATGRGFFVTMKLYKSVEETCDSFCALCWTNDINVKFQQARRYDQLWTRPWVRVLDVDRHVDKLRLPWPVAHFGRGAGRAALTAFDATAIAALGRDVELTVRFDERFDRLSESVGPKLGIAPVKDSAYLRWRYLDWPHLRTTTYVLKDKRGPIRGYVVLLDPADRLASGRILDLVTDPEDTVAALTLGSAAIRHYRSLRLSRIECIATAPHLQRALSMLLFVPRLPELPLFFLNGDKYPRADHLRRVENWHHSFGDSEGGEVP